MDKSIYTYILRHTRKDQIALIFLTLMSMPLVYYALEIPKIIINEAIGGTSIVFDFWGLSLTQINFLLLLSTIYLVMVIINGGMKFIINVYRGVLGERMLRRFRYELYQHILRFPQIRFKNLSAGEIIPMVTVETEPLGGFIGDSIALPIMQGGLLITYLSFIFVQDFWLGLASVALYPPQIYLIPRLQAKINQLSKQRVQHVRKLSDHVGESVAGIADIHTNDTGHFERALISRRLGDIFGIRNEIYRRKFFIKFLNNFLAQLTPFFFFSIGGYLVLKNQLSLGAMVAVLAAYKDISPPWKELLKFYQITEDVKVKYSQIIEQFTGDDLINPKLLESEKEPVQPLQGKIHTHTVSYVEDGFVKVDNLNLEINIDRHVAIISKDGTASDELSQLLARLINPSSGSIQVAESALNSLPEAITGQRIGYCFAGSQIFNTSLRDNLYYGLKHRPVESNSDDEAHKESSKFVRESIASGNSTDNSEANWVDISLAGAKNQDEFDEIVHAMIECVELDDDLLTLALRTATGIDIPIKLAEQVVTLRNQLVEQINQIGSDTIIEVLDRDNYVQNLTVEENLLFGTPKSGVSATEFLTTNPLGEKALKSADLKQELSQIGLEMANLMVELFSDVPDDSELFDQFSFIKAADLPEYQKIVTATGANADTTTLNDVQNSKLFAVSLKLCPARHRLDLITPEIQQKIVSARKFLIEQCGAQNDYIQFFEQNKYNHSLSVQENLLFGRIVYSKGHLQPQVTETIKNVLKSTGLNQAIVLAGLNSPAGSGGAKLSLSVRQKLTLARTLLKNPDILIINNTLAGLDGKQFSRILDRIIKLRQGKNLIWALHYPKLALKFDQVIILEKNKLLRYDSTEALMEEIQTL